MKGDGKVLGFLNKVLRNELTAINQYFLHSRMFRDWGLSKLGDHEYNESIDEMKHADLLVARILFLEGTPDMENAGKLSIGGDTREILECDLKMETDACEELKEAIAWCEQCGDYTSRDLFKKILSDEEEHIDWLETQLGLIERAGLQNYQQSMMG